MGTSPTPPPMASISRELLCRSVDGSAFHKVGNRTCQDYGLVPLLRAEDCWAAARASGVRASAGGHQVVSFTSDPQLPVGCFLKDGQEVWMRVRLIGNASGDRQL